MNRNFVYNMGRKSLVLPLLIVVCASTFVSARQGTPSYHPTETIVVSSSDEEQVIRAVQGAFQKAGDAIPLLDRRLVDAARRYLSGTRPVRNALMAAGLSDSFVLPIEFNMGSPLDGADPIEPVQTLIDSDVRAANITHFGVGVGTAGNETRVAIVFVRRRVHLSHFPKRLKKNERFMLTGNLESSLVRPMILVATPQGQVREVKPRHQHNAFWAMVPFDAGLGRYVLEVQAHDEFGEQVLSLLEVYVDDGEHRTEAPVVRLTPQKSAPKTTEEAELRVLSLINRTRQQAGLNSLRHGAILRQEARRHVEDMSKHQFFGHVSPSRGNLSKRLQFSGLRGIFAGENIAVAATPEAAHAELVRSPSHLRNIVDPNITHVGVGAQRRVVGDVAIYTFSQIFATFRR